MEPFDDQQNLGLPPTSPHVQMYDAREWQRQTDLQHLKLLSIFHFIFAGLQLFGVCGGLFYMVLGGAMASGGMPKANNPNGPPPEAMAGFFLFFGGCIGVFCLVFGVVMLLAGLNLRRHRRKAFCQVAAGMACISVPLGTVLGIFTFIALSRPSVAALFDESRAGENP